MRGKFYNIPLRINADQQNAVNQVIITVLLSIIFQIPVAGSDIQRIPGTDLQIRLLHTDLPDPEAQSGSRAEQKYKSRQNPAPVAPQPAESPASVMPAV